MFDNLPSPAPGFKRVIRVEPKESDGSSTFGILRDELQHWCHLPTPQEDRIRSADWYMCQQGFVCGTLEHQFATWFPDGILHAIPQYGLQCVALDVPEDALHEGKKQVIFDREQARLVQVLL